ncbi:hypothetical protein LMG28727_04882 [Paraburkholderia kirstenboschensis]|nr:hypothetical protein LMG28727_04882 [Paraburkholderia kirstenboschensis]
MSNGGPAFPVPEISANGPSRPVQAAGITIRDYFAAAALQGILSGDQGGNFDASNVRVAYLYADEMMRRRG